MNWNCPACGYAMDAFDTECPKCHGKGIEKPAPPAPVTPDTAKPQIPGTTIVGAAGPGGLPPVVKFVDPPRRNTLPYLLACAAYGGGYFLPWWTAQLMGRSSMTGPKDVQLAAAVAAGVAAILMIIDQLQGQNDVPVFVQLRTLISTGCLAFAGNWLVVGLAISKSIQWSFGLPLMVVAAVLMLCFDFYQLDESVKPTNTTITSVVLVGALLWGGYRGNEANKVVSILASLRERTNEESGGATSQETQNNAEVEVVLNSAVQAGTLQPKSEFFKPRVPAQGKTFLICNVTATLKAGADKLQITCMNIHLKDANGKEYSPYIGFGGYQNINFIDGTIAQNESLTGDVIFEVDAGTQPSKVEFSPF